jgi:hypothetical protein
MPSLKILCTRKTANAQAHLAITHVGGANNSHMPWTLTVDEAIRTIELKQYTFVVMKDGRRTEVLVAQSRTGQKYLKCTIDGIEGGTLSQLPDCP